MGKLFSKRGVARRKKSVMDEDVVVYDGHNYYSQYQNKREAKHTLPGFIILMVFMVSMIALLNWVGKYFGN